MVQIVGIVICAPDCIHTARCVHIWNDKVNIFTCVTMVCIFSFRIEI